VIWILEFSEEATKSCKSKDSCDRFFRRENPPEIESKDTTFWRTTIYIKGKNKLYQNGYKKNKKDVPCLKPSRRSPTTSKAPMILDISAVTRRGPPSYKVGITPANPMKNHGCKWA